MKITKKNIVKFYEECFNNQQLSLANQWISDDYIQHNPGLEQGREGFVQAVEEKFSSNEYFKLKLDSVLLNVEYSVVFLKSIDEQNKNKSSSC